MFSGGEKRLEANKEKVLQGKDGHHKGQKRKRKDWAKEDPLMFLVPSLEPVTNPGTPKNRAIFEKRSVKGGGEWEKTRFKVSI